MVSFIDAGSAGDAGLSGFAAAGEAGLLATGPGAGVVEGFFRMADSCCPEPLPLLPAGVAEGTSPGSGGAQPGGACTSTMLLHLGHARICPTTAGSRTRSFVLQVVQRMEKR